MTEREAQLQWPSVAEAFQKLDQQTQVDPNTNVLPTMVLIESIVPEAAGCSISPTVVRCFINPEKLAGFLNETTLCLNTEPQCLVSVAPDEEILLRVFATVNAPAPVGPLRNVVTASGGGSAEAKAETANEVGSPPSALGFSRFTAEATGLAGERDTQAGDHPYELTLTFGFNSAFRVGPEGQFEANGIEDPKDIDVNLPLGFVGSILAAPRCTFGQLSSADGGGCPKDTIIGHLRTLPAGTVSINSPIFNMVPERGVPAEFGVVDTLAGAHVLYTHVVPTPAGYVLQNETPDIAQLEITSAVVKLYGNPAVRDESGNAQIPFFTDPTDCSGSEPTVTAYMDSWQHPARENPDNTPVNLEEPQWVKAESKSPPMTGCDALQFGPELKAQPTTHQADSPSGLNFELKLFQSEETGVPATPTLKNSTVSFPEGMTVDPSAGGGLEACSVVQIGWMGGSPFNFNAAPPECPEASKIGELQLETPLVSGTLRGAMYLAEQNENPFRSVFATYVVVNDPVTGVVLKFAGEVKPDPHTGRLTAYFPENPNLPFSDLQLHFFGGPRSEFTTPPSCGTFTTTSILEPWSAPDSGPPATPFDSFTINEQCATGFNPSFTAGATNLQAGAFTTFVASFAREDDDQELADAEITLPPGLLANVPSVSECGEAELGAEEAGAPTGGCPESSQVGTVKGFAGPGPDPLFVGGKVFWTGPYKGGPYGLAVVVPAIAGPFHLGEVVVRESIHIDPHTAQVTDISDPFPTILDPVGANGQTAGIPIKLRRIDVEIGGRPGHPFTFNPTNCAKETFQVGGHIISVADQSKTLATPFQVTNCANLKFAPAFSVTTSGKTSKAQGASLMAKVTYPSGTQGVYADIAKVKVELPKALPSRLTTLQKACTNARFEANPAGCPAASKIGFATVHTPILPGALTGPVIFVSHGGEAFPSLTIVLQGDGVTIDLVGTTFISKAGITSTTFKTVPDSPFSTFELTLPEGPYSALAANGDLCTKKLAMPNEFVAQNGAVIHDTTTIAITGCPKVKAKKVTKRHKAKKGHKAKGSAKRGRSVS